MEIRNAFSHLTCSQTINCSMPITNSDRDCILDVTQKYFFNSLSYIYASLTRESVLNIHNERGGVIKNHQSNILSNLQHRLSIDSWAGVIVDNMFHHFFSTICEWQKSLRFSTSQAPEYDAEST